MVAGVHAAVFATRTLARKISVRAVVLFRIELARIQQPVDIGADVLPIIWWVKSTTKQC
jgi:hypothetical protein